MKRKAIYHQTVNRNPWIPTHIKLGITPKQAEFLSYQGREALYGGAAGCGKAGRCPDRAAPSYNESMETKVLTPKGFKLLGDVKVGDQVCNPDGTVARVVAIHDHGRQQFYRVTLADGSSVEASEGHLWAVSISGARRRQKVAPPIVPAGLRPEDEWNLRLNQRCRIVTTRELAELVGKAGREKGKKLRPHHVLLPLTAPVKMTGPQGRWPVLPPYTLGALVGDGHLAEVGVIITCDDAGIIEAMQAELGDTLRLNLAGTTGKCPYYRLAGAVGQKTDSPQQLLKRDGLLGTRSWNKFVPERIKVAPVDVRFAFIRGLFDTDGHMDARGHVEFTTVSERLAKDVQWLLRSLGFKAKLTTKQPTYTYKGEKRNGRMAYRLHVRGPHQEKLFGLPRKAERAKQFNGGEVWPAHQVVSVVPTVKDNARCITVNHPNSLYVTDDFIVTHNSVALLVAALQWIEWPGANSLILRRTFKQLNKSDSIMQKAIEWLVPLRDSQGRKADWNKSDKKFTFPNGNTLEFGHVEHDQAVYDYQGGIWSTICVDECTQFTEFQIAYPRSRQRRAIGSIVPMRWRGATNPGGIGHQHIKDRYVKDANGKSPATANRQFFPAKLADNPHIDREAYIEQLRESGLDPLTIAQLLDGDWDAVAGGRFQRTWFEERWHRRGDFYVVGGREYRLRDMHVFSTCDPAASASNHADYTVISVWAATKCGKLLWLACVRFKADIPDITPKIAAVVTEWRPAFVGIEAIASNRAVYQIAARWTNPMIPASPLNKGERDKLVHASTGITLASTGRVILPAVGIDPRFPIDDVIAELTRFTGIEGQDANDDIVDTLSYAAECMMGVDPSEHGNDIPRVMA